MKLIFSTLLLVVLQVLPSVHAYGRGSSYNPLTKLMKRSTAYTEVDNHHFHVHIHQQEGFKLKDKITTLPGQPIVHFDQYSGYITVDPNSGRALFYYFTESEDSAAKPLVLWLNGGPGCSSLGAGAMTELGPFRVHADGETLWVNKGAWNKLANLIFLESPAGVGFSYSNTTADYAASGDGRTAQDSFTFLMNWFERFPEYKNRAFYITGESYAGHYVPQLAQLIIKSNQTVINLKGIAIGNAYIDEEDMNKGLFEFYWRHTLLPDEIHKGIAQNCNFSLGANLTALCEDYSVQATEAIGKIFPYDIYAPTCSSSSSTISGYDPCSDQYVNTYLNKPEVQKALHANIGPWEVCSDSIGSMWLDSPLTVLPTIKELMSTGIRVWIYSGDTDAVVPVTTTSLSLPKLTVGTKTPWYPWYSQGSEGEVGGYAVEYENITFVTVKGAGHFVPSYKPESALTLFASFLDGKLRKKPTP